MSRWRLGFVLILTVSAVYLYAFPTATIIYGGGVLLHVGVGVLLAVLLIPILRVVFRESSLAERGGWVLLTAGTLLGLALIKIGTPNRFKAWLYVHIALCAAGVLMLGSAWVARRGWFGKGLAGAAASFAILALAMAGVAAGSWWTRNVAWKNTYRVVNPKMPAETMDGEGDGPNGKFFPARCRPWTGKTYRRNISCSHRRASAATRTFTSNGTARHTIFRRSTTSGTARALSTCRTLRV